jgi:hypothetical protein
MRWRAPSCLASIILCALELDAIDVSLRKMLVGDSSTVKSALVDDAREHLAQLAGDPSRTGCTKGVSLDKMELCY